MISIINSLTGYIAIRNKLRIKADNGNPFTYLTLPKTLL